MQIEIHTKYLRAALLFIGKRDVRPYGNGLHFCEINGFLAIEATDGCRLIRITTATQSRTGIDVIVPRAAIKSALKNKRVSSSFEFDCGMVSFRRESHRQTWDLIDDKYVDLSVIIPKTWNHPRASCTIRPKYLADAWDAVSLFQGFNGASGNLVEMISDHPSDRAIYREELDGNVIEIVIMAMRT